MGCHARPRCRSAPHPPLAPPLLTLRWPSSHPRPPPGTAASLQVARYLVAFAWSLKAILREPVHDGSRKSPEDVLRALLPDDEVPEM